MAIKLLITDFDGTLADTFEPNYAAYCEAFAKEGKTLSREKYQDCFGLRFDRFMDAMGIVDAETKGRIKEAKADAYPRHFDKLRPNTDLLEVLRAFKAMGGKIAIASTASERNLRAALRHMGAEDDFDLILAGESVKNGKPDPEIYLTVLKKMGVKAEEAIVFEDSQVGLEAAKAAGIEAIQVTI